jgi:hypothetical protein
MKHILIAGLLILTGCSIKEADHREEKEVTVKEYYLNLSNTTVCVSEYEIDGCQYIGHLTGNRQANYLTHKGNCTNPIHR